VKALHHRVAHAGETARQRGGLRRQHQPHDRRRQRRADADAMRADQVALQGGQFVLADALGRELAEAGVDAVDRVVAGRGGLHDGGAATDRRPGVGVQRERHAAGADAAQLLQRELAGDEFKGGRHGISDRSRSEV
jgi:hypothetical protein